MKKLPWLLVMMGCLSLTACEKDTVEPLDDDPLPGVDCAEQAELCALSAANNHFGFGVFQRLHQSEPEKNLFISPTSIGTALAMTMNGAAADTRQEMMDVMELEGLKIEEVNAAYQTMLLTLPTLDQAVDLKIANSIWYRQGFPVLPGFLMTTEKYYNSEVQELDFADPAALHTINGWVNDKTEGLIDKILNNVPGNVVMYLINAIYFKGDWAIPFDPKSTSPAPFYLAGGGQVEIDMMNHGGIRLPYFENEQLQAVDLSYGDNEAFSMSILVPKPASGLDELIEELERGTWSEWSNDFAVDSILFAMPKFEMEYEKKLNEVLKSLGMTRIFDAAAADFSNMVPGGGVWVDEVRHKSFISVDEKGTEAAAVTSVAVVESVPTIPVVILNRPFLFLIREKWTNSVLFIGKMMDPNQR